MLTLPRAGLAWRYFLLMSLSIAQTGAWEPATETLLQAHSHSEGKAELGVYTHRTRLRQAKARAHNNRGATGDSYEA